MVGLSIDQLSIGQSASFSKTISESDVYMFAGVTGDVNPAHINESYANATPFKTRIAHGMLSAGLISAVLGTQLPGPGSIYAAQTLRFTAPVQDRLLAALRACGGNRTRAARELGMDRTTLWRKLQKYIQK